MPRDEQPQPHQLVPYLKERIYVTFIGLAVLLALNTHPDDTSAGAVAGSLVIAAVGAGLAGLVSDATSCASPSALSARSSCP
jgi:hypothetical protein